jgi:hypothetical protein
MLKPGAVALRFETILDSIVRSYLKGEHVNKHYWKVFLKILNVYSLHKSHLKRTVQKSRKYDIFFFGTRICAQDLTLARQVL